MDSAVTHLVPVLIGKVLSRRPSLDPSAVDNNIDDQAQPALGLASSDLLAQTLDLSFVGKITLYDVYFSTEGGDLVPGVGVRGRGGSLNEDDVGSGLGESESHSLTDTSSTCERVHQL